MKSAAPTNFTADRQHRAQAMLTPGSDRRVIPRFRVDFRTIMSANSPMIEQMGSVLDLSLAGGRVETSLTVQTSLVMELRIYVPDLDWPTWWMKRSCNGSRGILSVCILCDCAKTKRIAWSGSWPESQRRGSISRKHFPIQSDFRHSSMGSGFVGAGMSDCSESTGISLGLGVSSRMSTG